MRRNSANTLREFTIKFPRNFLIIERHRLYIYSNFFNTDDYLIRNQQFHASKYLKSNELLLIVAK